MPEIAVEKFKKMVGRPFQTYLVEVEKGTIRRLAEAVGDENPMWRGGEKSEEGKCGDMFASPALCLSMMMYGFHPGKSISVARGLDASHHWKFHAPIKAKDVIQVESRLTDVYERSGKRFGKMVFFEFETVLTNQQGEKVCTHRGTMLAY